MSTHLFTAPLSNGQLYSFREIESYPPGWRKEANLPGTWDLRGHSMAEVTAALRALARRHEPLRTSYLVRDGAPVQCVHDEPELPVELVDLVITDHGLPDRTTAELLEREIPITGGLCWRGRLVHTGGTPMFLSLSFSHLILDVWSTQRLREQFAALLADPAAAAPDSVSQAELARRHHDPSWQRRQAGAEQHWRRVLGERPTPALPTLAAGVRRPRVQATLHSHRLGRLATSAATQLGVTTPAVLMGLVAAGLAQYTGASRVVVSQMSSNRFAPELLHAVGTLNQLVPVVVEVDNDRTVGEHVTGVHWAAAKAYRHSCYDVDRIAAVAAELGATAAHDGWFNQLFPCWFNYLQLDDHPGPAADEPAALEWSPAARQYGQPFDVRVSVREGRTSLALRTDPEVVPPDGVADILRAVAVGCRYAAHTPSRALKDLWTDADPPLPSALFPPRG